MGRLYILFLGGVWYMREFASGERMTLYSLQVRLIWG